MAGHAGGAHLGGLGEIDLQWAMRIVTVEAVGRTEMGIAANFMAHGAFRDSIDTSRRMLLMAIGTANRIAVLAAFGLDLLDLCRVTLLAIALQQFRRSNSNTGKRKYCQQS
jgi:hypothetical protein